MDQPSYLRGKADAYKEVADSFLSALGNEHEPEMEAFFLNLVNGYTDLSKNFHAAANAQTKPDLRLVKPENN